MKRAGCITVLAALAILVALMFAWNWYTHSPKGAFRRHFDSIPDSVTDITVHGYTALAGSSEQLVFRISEEDLDGLVRHRGFVEVTDLIRSKTKTALRRDHPDAYLASELRDSATHFGVNPDRFFIITKFDQLVWYLLVTDTESELVLYWYDKT